MIVRRAALIFGLIFLATGVGAFVPALVSSPAGQRSGAEVVLFLGLFPTNAIHNIFHIAFGIAGLVASRDARVARWFLSAVGVVFAALTVIGLIPTLSTLFGYMPIHGWDVLLHAAFVLAAVGVLGYTRAE